MASAKLGDGAQSFVEIIPMDADVVFEENFIQEHGAHRPFIIQLSTDYSGLEVLFVVMVLNSVLVLVSIVIRAGHLSVNSSLADSLPVFVEMVLVGEASMLID